MSKHRTFVWLPVLLAGALWCQFARADDPLVYATVEPTQITLGESARFTVTDLGNGTTPIAIPKVAGLQFELVGRRNQIEFVNGTALQSTAVVMRVTPQMAGIFSIPGVTPNSQPVVLQVNAPGAKLSASPSAKPVQPYRAPILSGATLPRGVHLTEDGSAFVRMSVPKREVYVGESVPVQIELGLRSGFVTSVNGLPKLTGDNFTLNNLSRQPEREEKLIDGEPFVILTWRSVLSVVKPGTFALVAETPLTIKVRTRPRRDSLLDDQFGDPFLQNFFGATVPKDINVASPPSELTVLALPTAGRPADFHGAIGTFDIESDISASTAAAGDPMTLRMRVRGSGNFDRVDSAMLDHVDQWKTYPPRSSFTSSDSSGQKGEKTFEQPVIALRSGAQTLPALTFSYFDPTIQRYETARSTPLRVNIAPSPADSTFAAPQAAVSGMSTPEKDGLRPDHAADATLANSLVPLYLRPKFLAVPSLLSLGFALGWFGVRRRVSIRKIPGSQRKAARAIKRILEQLESAARSGDIALFLNLARDAVQQSRGREARPDDDSDDIKQLIALADEAKYSGRAPTRADFSRWILFVRGRLLGEKP